MEIEEESEADGLLEELAQIQALGGEASDVLVKQMLDADKKLRATHLLIREPARLAVHSAAFKQIMALQVWDNLNRF